MNQHTAKMLAAKHGARFIVDRSASEYHIETKDGRLITLTGDRLKEHTTASLEALIVRERQEVQP